MQSSIIHIFPAVYSALLWSLYPPESPTLMLFRSASWTSVIQRYPHAEILVRPLFWVFHASLTSGLTPWIDKLHLQKTPTTQNPGNLNFLWFCKSWGWFIYSYFTLTNFANWIQSLGLKIVSHWYLPILYSFQLCRACDLCCPLALKKFALFLEKANFHSIYATQKFQNTGKVFSPGLILQPPG